MISSAPASVRKIAPVSTSNSAVVTPKNNQSIIVNLGGVIQDPTDDYSISGSTLEFTIAPISGLSFSAIILGSAYDNIITTSEYSEVAGISTTSQYASVAGISTTSQYASVAGIATYASNSGISTVSENLTGTPDIVVGAVTAGSVNSSGIVTASSFSGTVPSSSLSGSLPAIDGSQLTGITVNTSFLVSGRSSNTTILLSSGSFSIEGRAGDIIINAWCHK